MLDLTIRNAGSIFLVGVALSLALACGGTKKLCVGEISADGKTYTGTDADEQQARRNTCSKYCIEGDAGYDRLYNDWLKSPQSRKVASPDKWAGQAEDKKLGEYVRQCEQECLKNHESGKQKINVKCD